MSVDQWWIVTGRVEFDDEDTLLVLLADSDDDAVSRFKAQLRDDDPITEAVEDRREIFINYVVACGAVKPEIIQSVPA